MRLSHNWYLSTKRVLPKLNSNKSTSTSHTFGSKKLTKQVFFRYVNAAYFRFPSGSPLSCTGHMFFQKMEWLTWPPPLKWIVFCTERKGSEKAVKYRKHVQTALASCQVAVTRP